MNNTIKNTRFDNLVNYQNPYPNSINVFCAIQTSSDPNSLAYKIKNQQLITYKLIVPIEKTII